MMELVQGRFFFRCLLCDSLFDSGKKAELCCKRAKVQIACERLRQCSGIGNECNLILSGLNVKIRI